MLRKKAKIDEATELFYQLKEEREKLLKLILKLENVFVTYDDPVVRKVNRADDLLTEAYLTFHGYIENKAGKCMPLRNPKKQ